MKKRIYICNTGGTIGMQAGAGGYQTCQGFLESQMRDIPEITHPSMPDYELNEYDPLLDSANMRPANWLGIARDISSRYSEFDGFVVIHGTDTMAYTASALAFLIQGLGKPVVLTGSQIPLCEIRNDARENLITSMLIAANSGVAEVTICFGGYLLRGCRSRKFTASGFDAFQSPNLSPLGTIGTEINIRTERVLSASGKSFGLMFERDRCPQVAAFRLFPGMDHEILDNLFRPPLKGIVIEAFGVGNAPSEDPKFLQVIRSATDRGVVVVVCSQCTQGVVDLKGYASGQALEKAGAISGMDMTAEAALAKLYCLLNCELERTELESMMQADLAGELTMPVEVRASAQSG
ncbi:MAG: asparaginase [Planctomycetota bacterium]|nr:asparaginase [Planctomycetota bacterium]